MATVEWFMLGVLGVIALAIIVLAYLNRNRRDRNVLL